MVCVCFVSPLAEQTVLFLTRSSSLIGSGQEPLRAEGNEERERQVQPEVHPVCYLFRNNTQTPKGLSWHVTGYKTCSEFEYANTWYK